MVRSRCVSRCEWRAWPRWKSFTRHQWDAERSSLVGNLLSIRSPAAQQRAMATRIRMLFRYRAGMQWKDRQRTVEKWWCVWWYEIKRSQNDLPLVLTRLFTHTPFPDKNPLLVLYEDGCLWDIWDIWVLLVHLVHSMLRTNAEEVTVFPVAAATSVLARSYS